MADATGVKELMAFFKEGSDREVTTKEFMDFWKSCTDEQKAEYKAELALV